MSPRLMRRVRAALPMLVLALASCSGDAVTGDRERIDVARAKRRWAQSAPAAYQITVRSSCFCIAEEMRSVIVTVRDGQVESRRYDDTGADVPAEFARAYPTVDGLFDLIATSIANGAERVDVAYDATFGFPVSIVIDARTIVADDETFFWAKDFVVR